MSDQPKKTPKVIRKEQPRTIKDITTASEYELKDLVKKSKVWFDKESKELASIAVVKTTSTMTPVPGAMYTFRYNAKHKDILPFWDKQPLIFPFTILQDGFIGINFHYLHYKDRILLLSALESIASSNRTDISTKLKLSYSVLQSVAKNKKYEKCIHRYLFAYMKTPLKKVHSKNWISSVLLPNEMFVGLTAKEIWGMK